MITLVTGGEVYTPKALGVMDILVVNDRIIKIAPSISPPRELGDVEIIDAQDMKVFPGLIDQHVHIAGAGGEGGFQNRTPEISLTRLTTSGITTVVGLLGTDGTTRTVQGLLAKARALKIEGVTAYIYTGAYQVPTRTITENTRSDIVLIEEVIGVGEIAVSDDRSTHPSDFELARLAAEARVGGLLSGKAGVVHVHFGDAQRRMTPIFDVLKTAEIPITQFIPTHLNRNPYLLEHAIKFGKMGGTVDITSSVRPNKHDNTPIKASIAVRMLLENGVNIANITMSSDGNGSLPIFDEHGGLTAMGIASTATLWEEIRDLILQEGFAPETAVAIVTANVAKVLG
jgi:beta-aspartyl-dipeptidase (metallo-type)